MGNLPFSFVWKKTSYYILLSVALTPTQTFCLTKERIILGLKKRENHIRVKEKMGKFGLSEAVRTPQKNIIIGANDIDSLFCKRHCALILITP